ncbi:hypothetical protein GGI42DRAFT_362602, partial [Trichoderma sp. SZMC 28013]
LTLCRTVHVPSTCSVLALIGTRGTSIRQRRRGQLVRTSRPLATRTWATEPGCAPHVPKKRKLSSLFYIAVGSGVAKARASCVLGGPLAAWVLGESLEGGGGASASPSPSLCCHLATACGPKSIGDTRSGPTPVLLFPAPFGWGSLCQTVRAGTGWTLAMEGGPRAVSGRAGGWGPGMQADSEPCVAGIAGSRVGSTWKALGELGLWWCRCNGDPVWPSMEVIWQPELGSFDSSTKSLHCTTQASTSTSTSIGLAQLASASDSLPCLLLLVPVPSASWRENKPPRRLHPIPASRYLRLRSRRCTLTKMLCPFSSTYI